VIIATDMGSDPDDQNSLIRYLSYANEFETEGIVITPMWDWRDGRNEVGPATAQSLGWALQRLDAYEKVLSSLQQHATGFPSAAALRAVTATHSYGMKIWFEQKTAESFWDWIGEGTTPYGQPKDTEASNLVVKALEKNDPRPIYVVVWGGTHAVVQGIYRYEKRNPGKFARDKLRIYNIFGQDTTTCYFGLGPDTFTNYTGPMDTGFFHVYDRGLFWEMTSGSEDTRWGSGWVLPNIRNDHGPLGATYVGDRIHEGDSPSFIWLLGAGAGLTNPNRPDQSGWAGRAEHQPSIGPKWYVTRQDYDSLRVYREDFERDFAARMDWQVRPFSGANHRPIAALDGDNSRAVVYRPDVQPGATVDLDASASTDPDGNALSYEWFYDVRSSTYQGGLNIENANAVRARVTVPAAIGDKNVQVVLRVRDNGDPPLVSYKRLVLGGAR
jgi:hypothetical protein